MALSTVAAAVLWACTAAVADGQTIDADFPAAGLVADFRDQHGNRCQRVDTQIAFAWHDRAADPRLASGTFDATWRGLVLLRASGDYRLDAFAEGDVRVTLDGETVLQGSTSAPAWIAGTSKHRRSGFRELEIHFTKTQPTARLTLYWSGPDFGREPISGSSLYHDHDQAPSDAFERGRQLAAALRCTACHEIPTALPPLPAPALDAMAGNLSASWVAQWLSAPDPIVPDPIASDPAVPDPAAAEAAALRRMPHFALTAADSRAIAAYLTSGRPSSVSAAEPDDKSSPPARKDPRPDRKQPSKKESKKQPKVDAASGEQLFVSLGCLACHQRGTQGSSGLFGGGDLSRIGEKRNGDFFRRWLTEPAKINRHHRMPVFDLSADETTALARFLVTLVAQDSQPAPPTDRVADPKEPSGAQRTLIAQGRRLVAQHRCNACHALPQAMQPDLQPAATPADGLPPAPALTATADWDRACVEFASTTDAAGPHAAGQPLYRLTADDAAAVRQYVDRVAAVRNPSPAIAGGADLLLRSNCLACHPRGLDTGITDTALPIADRYADVVAHVAALVPPSLNSIGDKLRDDALRRAIERTAERRRPWLAVRMPRYPLQDEQFDQLVRLFIETDRIPAGQPPASHESVGPPAGAAPAGHLNQAVLGTVGPRLVTSEGFGCISCHAIGGVQPAAAPINAMGPDLTGLGERIRPSWFHRWVANPLRIVPRVEMPAIAIPVPGVLDENLRQQVDAVWQVLNLEGFRPPQPNPVRIVRRQGIAAADQSAVVLTDVLRMDDAQWIKPLLIGLPNRHNVLIDLQHARLDGWWIGDTARQHVAGKSWYWEATGQNLWDNRDGDTDLTLVAVRDGQTVDLAPRFQGQFRTEMDQWRHVPGGLSMEHRLQFAAPDGSDSQPWTVNVQQTFGAVFGPQHGSSSGWQRTIQLSHVPPSYRVRLQAAPSSASSGSILSADRRQLRIAGAGDVRVQLVDAPGLRFDADGSVLASPDAKGAIQLTLRYTTGLPVDRFPMPPQAGPVQQPEPLDLQVAPGFSATQMALPEAIMPTGFAWQSDGAMVVTSLEGRVWRARDTDGDSLPDTAAPISDDLATPFGVAAGDGYLDVINKYALLRLWDDDRDGIAERTQTLVSGWGHTVDYHDWALGLPRADDGGYWVTLPCQQDERSDAAAYLRGTVIRLVPRQPSRENPHRFAIQPFTAGHRFPIGIAVNQAGDVFVTDNQGNYNPFNELNHLVAGARYGFINRNDRRPGFAPPLTPPAIDIPHPWTRSVNGICFLTTPPTIDGSAFGPFEGHLVGCEFDTQRLIRISLQQVGDTYQGAAYPLTYVEPAAGPPLLGPISCAVSPAGDLVVGNLRDSGWGGGQNTGNVVRMRMDPSSLPAGIAEVTALPQGFRIAFTRPVSADRAEDPANYDIASYTRTSTPQYGGEDQRRRAEPIRAVRYDAQQNAVTIRLAPLREDFVYEFQLANLTDDEDAEFFPAEAFYTLRAAPQANP